MPRSSAPGAGGAEDGATSAGGSGFGSGLGAASMTAVTADGADRLPEAFVAVTTTRIVKPTSAAVRSWVPPVAPGMSTHPVPAALQRCHWWVVVTGALPPQVPSSAVNLLSSRGVPLIAGGVPATGGAALTTAVGADVAGTLPPALEAVTRTRNVLAMSPVTRS